MSGSYDLQEPHWFNQTNDQNIFIVTLLVAIDNLWSFELCSAHDFTYSWVMPEAKSNAYLDALKEMLLSSVSKTFLKILVQVRLLYF